MKTIVIGAGPAGVVCANELAKKGNEVILLEASSSVGGMSKSFNLWGQIVDLGPHRFFSNNPRINNVFKEAIKDEYILVNRLTRIYFNRRFFLYPLKLFNVLGNLNLLTVIQILTDYIKQRIFPIRNPTTFEQWVTNRFGKKLFEIFFKNYSEKLWGIPCSKIDADWAAQRIKTLSLPAAVWSALTQNKFNNHKTLVDQFAYPNLGTGSIYENIAHSFQANGGKLMVDTPVKNVIVENGKALGVELFDGSKLMADQVVSTMPLTLLLKGMPDTPKRVLEANSKLYFRNTILVYLEVAKQDIFKDNWIYIHSPEVRHGRITNFSNWNPSINKGSKNSILCLEYWAFDNDDIWNASDEALSELAKKEVEILGFVDNHDQILNSRVHKVHRCYPVYETGYKAHLDIIVDYLRGIENLHPIGRYGSFKYNNQDHSILMGLLCADNIHEEKEVHNLWNINTDTEYQEGAKVKDVLTD